MDGSVALRYDSGAGNGPWGIGWSTTLPSIQRRTDKQLPRYEEEDVFVFAGAEDLVPALVDSGGGHWVPDVVTPAGIRVVRYRPRVEGGFARIEKITAAGETFWKVTSRDNVTTIFGRTAAARIEGPESRVFRWLPEWTYDDKGNCAEWSYKAEDLAGVPDVVEEGNRRAGLAPFANRYLKRIRYGNKTPYLADPSKPFTPDAPSDPHYLFDALFDYGEHDDTFAEARVWACRFDPFSDYRAGFEIRTYRLCRRILFFHTFPELSASPELVRSVDLEYRSFHFDSAPRVRIEAELLTSIRRTHYRGTAKRSLPPLSLTYQDLQWSHDVEPVESEEVVSGYQWIDLYRDGAPGILTEQGNAWYYKQNEGEGRFARAALVAPKPSFAGAGAGTLEFEDLDADGSRQVVSRASGIRGWFELDDDDRWLPFRSFDAVPNVDFSDPDTRLLDLDGDGRADLLISEELVFRWFPSLGRNGFDAPRVADKPADEERGPAIVFSDAAQSIFIADMSGDGLGDIVRVRCGEVVYWPNLGYGRFGAKVTMAGAPLLDDPAHFDPRLVQLADVSGTGAADLIYLGHGDFRAWINLAGNGWSSEQRIEPFPRTTPPGRVAVLDILGNGTVSLVWSSDLPADANAPLRYIDLMGGKKPYILSGYANNLGAEVAIEYRSSSHYALLDKRDGRPWATKLPFPIMCVSRTETRDRIAGTLLVHEARYRHGYYDHAEREFRGFGMVETTDAETFEHFRPAPGHHLDDDSLHQPPRRTRTWYHTGAFVRGDTILRLFANDYFIDTLHPEYALPDARIESQQPLTNEERRQAARACKGMVLREETWGGSSDPPAPYSTAEHNCVVRLLQPMLDSRYAVFLVHESEALTFHYERDPADPRVAHTLNTVVDEIGNAVESASVVYPRLAPDGSLSTEVQDEQARTRITYTVNGYTNDVKTDSAYRLRQVYETRAYEVTGVAASPFTIDFIRGKFNGAHDIEYEATPDLHQEQRRLIDHTRVLFASNTAPATPLALGTLQSLGIGYESYHLAFTPALLTSLYGAKVTPSFLHEGGYVEQPSGYWWIPSGTMLYPANPEQHFYMPDRYVDPFTNATTVRYHSDTQLLVEEVEDALGNRTTVQAFDFRVLLPQSVKDLNDNIVDISFDILGLVAGMATRGKGSEAEDLTGFVPDLTPAQLSAFFSDPAANGDALLQHATSRFVYRFDVLPAVSATIARETHYVSGRTSELRYELEYSDGSGRVAMKKVQAEPGHAKQVVVHDDGTYDVNDVDTTPNRRWIGSGRTIVNNKGNKVLQFEPYFSATHEYETAKELVESGVSARLTYDPLDRLIRTDAPDGSRSRVDFTPWQQQSYDANDWVIGSDWYAARIGGGLGADEQAAAQKAAVHDSTFEAANFDSLGRAIESDVHNRFRDRISGLVVDEHYKTLTALDIEGNRTRVRDPRGNDVMSFFYDLAARAGHTTSMDAGERWMLADVAGKPVYRFDAKGNQFHTGYDALRRPTTNTVGTIVFESIVYGTDKTKNQNGQLITHYDPAGVVANGSFDFDGNLLGSTRTFTRDYAPVIDWTTPGSVALQATAYTTSNDYDALKRLVKSTTPDNSVEVRTYSRSGSLATVDISVRGAPSKPFVKKITHDAKGQRLRIEYGNDVVTESTYDDKTFRVRRIVTTRSSPAATLQDLNYTYDPAGNVVHVHDGAQQPVFFNNHIVLPDNDFTFDAAYRIVAATGREWIAMNAPVDRTDAARSNVPFKPSGDEMQLYLQQYDYDAAGNLRHMVHNAGAMSPFANQWTRELTPHGTNNRLDQSSVGATVEPYTYDLHGNLTSMPSVSLLEWDTSDKLHHADLGGGGDAYFTYDAGGMRARKVVKKGTVVEERLYFGGFEVFTRTRGGATELVRETLHAMDDARRIAMIDTRTAGPGPGPAQLVRYQFWNNVGTASLEVDDAAAIVSYEEYYPFGSTSLQSIDQTREVPEKRYRYTGKERDDETGFYDHGARYYAPWLARWTAPDPAGLKDGANVYAYVHDNPVRMADPTGTQGHDAIDLNEFSRQIAGRALQLSPLIPMRDPSYLPIPRSLLLPTPQFLREPVRLPVLPMLPSAPQLPSLASPLPPLTLGPINLGGDLPNIGFDAEGNLVDRYQRIHAIEARIEGTGERGAALLMGRFGLDPNITLTTTIGAGASMQNRNAGFIGGAALRFWGTVARDAERHSSTHLAMILAANYDRTSDNPLSFSATGALTRHFNDDMAIVANLGLLGTFPEGSSPGGIGPAATFSFQYKIATLEVAYALGLLDRPGLLPTHRFTADVNLQVIDEKDERHAVGLFLNPLLVVSSDPTGAVSLSPGLGVTVVEAIRHRRRPQPNQ